MKITKSQKNAIIEEVKKKVNAKRNVEFEKFCEDAIIPSIVNEVADIQEEYNNAKKKYNKLQDKLNELRDKREDLVSSNKELEGAGFEYISYCPSREQIINTYLKSKFMKANPYPNIEHILDLELLRDAFDLDAFLSKF